MKIEIEITGEQLRDLFSTAIEAGDPVTTASRGGWCAGVFYKTERHTPPKGLWYHDTPAWYVSPNFQVEIVEIDDERTGHKTRHIVKAEQVAEGLAHMARKHGAAFGQIARDDIDGPCADLFLQCVVFGEIKYG